MYSVKCTSDNFNCYGTMINHPLNKSYNLLVIKIKSIVDRWFTIDKNNSFIEDIAQEQIDDLRSDNSNVYALIKKEDIQNVEIQGLEYLKYFKDLDNLKQLKIYIKEDNDQYINNILSIPKHLAPIIVISNNQKSIFNSSMFWKWVLNFPITDLEFFCSRIKITSIQKYINKDNIFESIIKVEEKSKEKQMNVDSLITSLLLSLPEYQKF